MWPVVVLINFFCPNVRLTAAQPTTCRGARCFIKVCRLLPEPQIPDGAIHLICCDQTTALSVHAELLRFDITGLEEFPCCGGGGARLQGSAAATGASRKVPRVTPQCCRPGGSTAIDTATVSPASTGVAASTPGMYTCGGGCGTALPVAHSASREHDATRLRAKAWHAR